MGKNNKKTAGTKRKGSHDKMKDNGKPPKKTRQLSRDELVSQVECLTVEREGLLALLAAEEESVARLEEELEKIRKNARGARLAYREMYSTSSAAWSEIPYSDEILDSMGWKLSEAVARLRAERDEAGGATDDTGNDSSDGLLSRLSGLLPSGPQPMRHVDEMIASDEELEARRKAARQKTPEA